MIYLSIVDITDPGNLKVANTIVVPHEGVMKIDGGKLYLLSSGQTPSLDIFDLANPLQPVLVSQTAFSGAPPFITDLAVQDDYAYLSGVGKGVTVVDVHNPAQPAQVSEFELNFVMHLALDATHLYLGPFGTVLDRSDPASLDQPEYILNQYTDSVAVQGDTVYLTSYDYGLWIYRRVAP
jgi:hypothetical protein